MPDLLGAWRRRPRGARTSIVRVLAHSLILVTLIPFLPLAYLSWADYRDEVRRVEAEIESSNRQLAHIAAAYLDSHVVRVHTQAQAFAASPERSSLPAGPSAIVWELMGPDGNIVSSQISSRRVGSACDYRHLLDLTEGASVPTLSGVGRWIPGWPPTVVAVIKLPARKGYLAGILDPENLHRDMTAWSAAVLDRHLYVVDEAGKLIFYSDIEISSRGDDLTGNPPIRMHVEGKEGSIRFRSIVSGKERLGFVKRLKEVRWGVVVSADIGSRLIGSRARRVMFAWSILFALMSATGILLATSRRLMHPLLQIHEALQLASQAPLCPLRVPPAARRIAEYDDLVAGFDDLSGRLSTTEKELVQAEKASLLGQLASGIAHEIGTPLNVISGNAQYLLRKAETADPSRPALHMIVRQAERITSMIQRFLDFSRPTEVRLEPVDLGSIAAQTLEMVPRLGSKIDLRVDIDPGTPPVMGDPRLLEHALLNLIVNAVQAMENGGVLSLVIGVGGGLEPPDGERTDELWVCCRVADQGCGIPRENLDRVFQPFFTTKPVGEGTGLGLAIVERIVRQHGGEIHVASWLGRGTVFAVKLRPASMGCSDLC